ncbi:MAG: shikimate dehydrogenase [Candidatus Omnitrophica bacterium]|nr:shikimate dehydrogenase [Candidatus Omnitrophota bacterium]
MTKLNFGIIGYPVKHSRSPAMHNAAFCHYGIEAEYKLYEVEPQNLKKFLLEDVFTLGLSGFNVTIPHKVKARQILEDNFPRPEESIMPESLYYVKLSGAINTVKRDADSLAYFNTDASGFLRSLKEDLGFDPQGKSVFLIGCGGAGRAVVAALSWKNACAAEIFVYEADSRAQQLAQEHFSSLGFPHLTEKIRFIAPKDIPAVIGKCSLLVNASPLGMNPGDPSAFEVESLHSGLSVYDLVYNQKETKLLQEAKNKGLKAANGLGMLLYQGADAFELWTGKPAPVDLMRKALEQGA